MTKMKRADKTVAALEAKVRTWLAEQKGAAETARKRIV